MNFLFHLFPPTIHPMVVHFTIATIYLTTLAGLVGAVLRRDAFYARAFFILLTLSILATLAAGVAGVISEYYVHVPQGTGQMLEAHKSDGEMTGMLLVVAFVIQWWKRRKSNTVSWLALLVCIGATILVSVTGLLGGSMVYDHGLGILHLTR